MVGLRYIAIALAALTPFAAKAQAPTSDYFRLVECGAAFMKTAIIFRAKRSIAERVNGEIVSLQAIDFWETRSRSVLDFLFEESVHADRAQGDMAAEMDAWISTISSVRDPRQSTRLEGIAVKTALDCNKELIRDGFFQTP